jgi:hypothetical protein
MQKMTEHQIVAILKQPKPVSPSKNFAVNMVWAIQLSINGVINTMVWKSQILNA